jgi:hypothetical protein
MIIPSKFDGYGEGGRLTSTRRVYDSGGGGGGAPEKTTQVTDLPDWAKPSAQKLLGKSEALTDINANPYQQYRGERIAGFTPLQQQSFQGAQNLGPASQIGAATGLAGVASMGALRPQQFAPQASEYMSPFMQNVVDREKLEAARASQMLGQQQQAQATQAGAFGGYREGIQRAERERGLRSQMQDIQSKGLQAAYDRGQQQFNTEQQLRMQGLQTALQGAGQLGSLGQQQFGQQKDVIGLQNAMGAQQQQLEQQRLSQQYQDFLNQQRYPYQQLEFMSNILRGTPMGSVQNLYNPTPSVGSQLLGAGTSLAGAYMLGGGRFAEGGAVDATDVTPKKKKGKAAGLAELAMTKI